MSEPTCKSCQFYRQHYGLDNKKLYRLYCGHCTLSATKRKRPDAKICDNYIAADADTDAFVTKEYLSKAVLQYILDLELLPEITDALRLQKSNPK